MSNRVDPQVQQFIQQQLQSGLSRNQVAQQLIATGWTPDQARKAVAEAPVPTVASGYPTARQAPVSSTLFRDESPVHSARNEAREHGKRKMLFGLLWFAGGFIVTLGSYGLANNSPTGGTYLVAWGAILFGFIDMIRGYSIYRSG